MRVHGSASSVFVSVSNPSTLGAQPQPCGPRMRSETQFTEGSGRGVEAERREVVDGDAGGISSRPWER